LALIPAIGIATVAEEPATDETTVSIDLTSGHGLDSGNSTEYDLDSIIHLYITTYEVDGVLNEENEYGTSFCGNAATMTVSARVDYVITDITYTFHDESCAPENRAYNAATSTPGIVNNGATSTFTGSESAVVMNFGGSSEIYLTGVTVTYKKAATDVIVASFDLTSGYKLDACDSVDYDLNNNIQMHIETDNTSIYNSGDDNGTFFSSDSAASLTVSAKTGYVITGITYTFSEIDVSPSVDDNHYNADTSTAGIVNSGAVSTFTGCESAVVMNFGAVDSGIHLISVTVAYKEGYVASIDLTSGHQLSACSSVDYDLDDNIKMHIASDGVISAMRVALLERASAVIMPPH